MIDTNMFCLQKMANINHKWTAEAARLFQQVLGQNGGVYEL